MQRSPSLAQPANSLAIPGAEDTRPGSFAFTASLDELFRTGWPHFRVLTDEVLPPVQARREALKACRAVDQYLPTLVPRDLARRFLSAYSQSRSTNRAPKSAEKQLFTDALTNPQEVDPQLMARILETKFGGVGGETYVYRIREVVFLLEAFLGTTVVAEALAEHLIKGLEPKRWGPTAFDRDHENGNYRRLLLAFGWLRLRLPARRWKRLVRPLRNGHAKLPRYSATLTLFADDSSAYESAQAYVADAACQRRDPAPLLEHLKRWPTAWDQAQWVYTLGADFLKECDVSRLRLAPKWRQQRHLAELGAIRAPGTLRVVEALLSSRAVGGEALGWLQAHRDWVVHEALPVIDEWPHAARVAASVRAALRDEVLPPTPKPRELRRQLERLFARLPQRMRACKGSSSDELSTLRETFATYCEINAALGEDTPSAYFTHQLGLNWGAPQADVERWLAQAAELTESN